MSDNQNGIFDMTVPTPMLFPVLLEAKAYMENGKASGSAPSYRRCHSGYRSLVAPVNKC